MVRHARARVLSALILLAVAASTAHGRKVLLQFTSPTCGPCRQMRPAIQQLAAGGFPIRMVDVSREPQTATQYGVNAWPTSILLIDDAEQARHVGPMTHEQLVRFVGVVGDIRMQSPDGAGVSAAVHSGDNPTTFADQTVSGRIFDIGNRHRSNPTGRDAGADVPGAPQHNSHGATSHAKLIESTVRLSVDDPEGRSSGTGSMIDTFQGETLVLTCGHIFRSSNGEGEIAVTLFQAGPSGPIARETVAGRLVNFDLQRDLALVAIRAQGPVHVAPVAPVGTVLAPRTSVMSVGCNHGEDPTVLETQITTVDRYAGTPNIEIAGAPVEGRSGGGLFDAQARVIGVCFAADPEGNEGLYVSLPAIHEKLDELHLTAVYESPSVSANTIAGAEPSKSGGEDARFEVRGQDPKDWPPAIPANTSAADAIAQREPLDASTQFAQSQPISSKPLRGNTNSAISNLTVQEEAALEEIIHRGAESEVVCIIRPQDAAESSEVIRLDGASPQFLEALQALQGGRRRR